MNRHRFSALVLFSLSLLQAPLVLAQTSVAEREARQQQRIEQGVQSGQLNRREAARLERREQAIQRQETRAMQDGQLDAAEKKRLFREQNAMSRDIRREKHDRQVAHRH